MDFSPRQRDLLLDCAREVIRRALRGLPPPPLVCHDLDLFRPAGCFCTLHAHEGGKLRGCVGRIDAVEPAIAAVAISAGLVLGDERFRLRPVTLAELPLLDLELSILSPTAPVASPLDFDLQRHGLFLTIGGRTGCFLPQVARETGWSKEQLLGRLCSEKMGLPAESWRQPAARLAVFTATIVGPEPFEPTAKNHQSAEQPLAAV